MSRISLVWKTELMESFLPSFFPSIFFKIGVILILAYVSLAKIKCKHVWEALRGVPGVSDELINTHIWVPCVVLLLL